MNIQPIAPNVQNPAEAPGASNQNSAGFPGAPETAPLNAPVGGSEESQNVQGGCHTCMNRTYVDVSDDSGVSFQAPTRLTPSQAASAVPAHEGEHVSREAGRASREGRRVVSSSVRIFTSVCPECGATYVSGGETRTVTASDGKKHSPAPAPGEGGNVDLTA